MSEWALGTDWYLKASRVSVVIAVIKQTKCRAAFINVMKSYLKRCPEETSLLIRTKNLCN